MAQSKIALPGLVTLQDAADIIKVHTNTTRQWNNKGILKAVKIGGQKDPKI